MADPFADADSFLSGGSNVAAKWPTVGFEFEGEVIGWDGPNQMTDMDTGEPLYWEGSKKVPESKVKNMRIAEKNPAMQLLVHVQGPVTGKTWETNQYIEKSLPDDDGVRTMYVHGELQKAIKKALREAGGAALEKGAHVKVKRTAPVKKGNGFFGYTYEATWTPAPVDPNAALNAAGGPEEDGDEPPF
jgi:hypothetical protein